MRLFIGVDLPPSVREAAALAAGELKEAFAARSPRAAVRWVEPANLHITLRFLGEVSDERAGGIETTLRPPLATRPFGVELGGAGVFPESGPPHAVWLGIRTGAGQLILLYEELTKRLDPLGFPAERRPYAAHLTVGRIKEIRRPDVPAFRRTVAQMIRPIAAWDVDAVTLFRSRPSPRGAQYEKLLRVPLG